MVLAAGLGTRLACGGEDAAKPLVPIRSVPALLRAILQLEIAGCRRVVVVTGHRASEIEGQVESWRPRVGIAVETIFNPDYRLKNGVSLLAARGKLSEEFVVAMADHVVGAEVMRLIPGLAPPRNGATLLVDRHIDRVFDLEDATKVRTAGDRLVAIGKELTEFDAVDIGVFVCTPGLLSVLADVRDEQGDASLSDGVARLARSGRMAVLDIQGGFWRDVDTPEMRAEAEAALARREP